MELPTMSLSTINIREILFNLSKKRPIFHVEADFQQALAWEIHNLFPASEMRLEFKPPLKERIYLDIWAKDSNTILAIELKYKTKRFATKIIDEEFDLLNQGAQDLGRYDFLKDIQRLEGLVSSRINITCYAILLTNDSGYWNQAKNEYTVDAHFRLSEGKNIHGELTWGQVPLKVQ